MTTPEIDPKICPLCGKPNQCAYQAGRPYTECWCMTTSVPKELLDQIPQKSDARHVYVKPAF